MYNSLSRHIRKFPSYNWDFSVLSSHPCLYLCVLKEHMDKPWNWNMITKHSNFSWDWVREFHEKPWDWTYLSLSQYFTWNWVREFPDKEWNWNNLSSKGDLTIDIIKEFPDKHWNWYSVTMHPNISTDIMLQNPNFPWKIEELFFTDIDEDILKFIRYFRSYYDFEAWMDHTSRTPWRIIKQNLDLPWVFSNVVLKSFDEFSQDDVKFLRVYRNWNWRHLSEMVHYNIIKQNSDLPWDHNVVSRNTSVHYRSVDSSWNLNTTNLQSEMKEWVASNIIKRYWKKCVTDPSYKMCRRVVLNELFDSLRLAQIDGVQHEKRED